METRTVRNLLKLLLVLLAVHAQKSLATNPVFSQVSLVSTIYEFETSIKTISDADCADTVDGDSVIVSLKAVSPSSAPCANCFQVYPNCGGGLGASYCLQFLPLDKFDYKQIHTYYLTMICTDTNGESVEATVDLRLIPNTPPFLSSAASVTTTLSNTENMKMGDSVYAVACSDPNSDALTYSLVVDPPDALFTIDTNGVIRASEDLNRECRTSVSFVATCQDPYNGPVGPIYVQTTLNGANQRPSITGINYILDQPEDAAVGHVLASFTVNDDDTPTCRLSSNPLEAMQYFDLDVSQRNIIVRTTLNYEKSQTRFANVTVTCTDDFCASSAAYLYVRVADVNEPITLLPQDFTLTAYEGLIKLDPGWTPLDEDQDDTPIYTLVSNTGKYLEVDPNTGFIRSTIDYDLDDTTGMQTAILVIQAKDEGDHTSSSTVTLSVLDYNDNAPAFTNPGQSFTISDCASVIGTTLGTVAATDKDSSFQGNNVITFSGGNGIITIGPTGTILVGGGLLAGSTYVVDVIASDSGQEPGPKSARTTVTVIVTACTTTVPPPTTTVATTTSATTVAVTKAPVITTAGNASENLDENLAWIVIAGLLGMLLLGVAGLMAWRYCIPFYNAGRFNAACGNMCGDCCAPRPPPRQVRPIRGQPPRNGNRGFWQERYPDDDYVDQPVRDRTPSPAPYEGGAPLAIEPAQSWRPKAIQY